MSGRSGADLAIRVEGLQSRVADDSKSEDAEDVLQDTFLRAYRGIKSFQGASTFSTWIYRITANSALMRLRKKQLPTVSIEDSDERETPVNIADWTPGPVEQLLSRELQHEMDEAIEALPPEFRQVFVLRDMEEMSNAEVAEVLDLSVAAVKSRLHRARLKVRNRLAGYFSDSANRNDVPWEPTDADVQRGPRIALRLPRRGHERRHRHRDETPHRRLLRLPR